MTLLEQLQMLMQDGTNDSLRVAADLVEEYGHAELASEWRTCGVPHLWQRDILNGGPYPVALDETSKQWNQVCDAGKQRNNLGDTSTQSEVSSRVPQESQNSVQSE